MPPPYDQNAVISFCPTDPEPSPASEEGPSLGVPSLAFARACASSHVAISWMDLARRARMLPCGAVTYLTSPLMAGLPGLGLGT